MTNPTGNAKPKEILSVPQLQKLALCHTFWEDRTSLGALLLKNPPGMQEFWVQSLGREDPLEKEMATRSSILAWGNPMERRAWRATVHRVTKGSDMA